MTFSFLSMSTALNSLRLQNSDILSLTFTYELSFLYKEKFLSFTIWYLVAQFA
jgi:hypothetical protein